MLISLRKLILLGLCLIVFSLPLYLIKWQISFVPFNLLETLIYFFFLLTLLDWLKRRKNQPRFFPLALRKYFLASWLIFLGLTLSTWFSSDLALSAGIWKAWLIAPLLFLISLVYSARKDQPAWRNILLSLFASGLSVSLIALFYWLNRWLTYDHRLKAFYLSPNHLAMYLAPVFILSLALYSFVPKKAFYWLIGLGQILILVIIYLTHSFGAWLGLLLAALVFFFKNKSRLKLFSLVFVLLIIILTSLWLAGPKTPAWQSRLVIWQSASQIIKDHWFLGIGPGLFQEYYLLYQPYFSPYPEWAVPQPHNLFLAFWLQAGLLGLIGFVWLLIVFFKQAFKKPPDWFKTVLIAAMAYTLAHGLIDTPYWKNDLALIFWLVIGLLVLAEDS